MFVQINTGIYVITALILFFIYFGDKFLKQKFDMFTIASSCCWILLSFSISAIILGNSSMMDSGVMNPKLICVTYLHCLITLITSGLIVNYNK